MRNDKVADPVARRLKALSAARPIVAPLPQSGRPKRTEARQSAFRIVRIVIDDGSELNAVLKDMTARGARIVLDGAHPLPPFVILKVLQTGVKRKAAVVWQREMDAGLCFDLAPLPT